MKIEISRSVARRMLRLDCELTVSLSYGGPNALPNCYKWRTPMREAWARLECPQLMVDESNEAMVRTPTRAYGRLGQAHEGYANLLSGGGALVRYYYRHGRNDPCTQEAAATALLYALWKQYKGTVLGELAGQMIARAAA